MSTGPINLLSSLFLQPLMSRSTNPTNAAGGPDGSSQAQQPDNSQLSPFARMMSELEQLQQSGPAKYQQVTAQIATNLQNAAQTAQAAGNTAAATRLNNLAQDFSDASKSGQLPNFQNVAQGVSGHHGGHHHHGHHAAADANSNSILNPASIIQNTLSSSGVTGA